MRRLLPLLLSLLLAGCAQGAPSGPTQAPGRATWTPTAVGTLQARQRPTVTTSPPPATPTRRATPGLPAKGAYTRMVIPTAWVCEKSVRLALVQEGYTFADIRLNRLIFDLDFDNSRLADKDYLREAKAAALEIARLDDTEPCTQHGKQVLMEEANALLSAFDYYRYDEGAAAIALGNAHSASVEVFYWIVGMDVWRPIPILH